MARNYKQIKATTMTQEQRQIIFNCIVITKCGANQDILNLNDEQLLNELIDSCQGLHDNYWQSFDEINNLKSRYNQLINNF
jgi:regulator of RNase E activity RraB